MAGFALQSMYNLVDAIYLGRVSAAALAAPSIGLNILLFVIVFGMGFANAGSTLVAQSNGKGDRDRVDFYLGQTIALLLAMSLVIMSIGQLGLNGILRLLQVPPEVEGYTRQYLRILFMAVPFMYTTFAVRTALQGTGNGVTPLFIEGSTIILNIILDPILIFGFGPIPAMEVQGAAIATLISRAAAAGISLLVVARGRRGVQLHASNLRVEREAFNHYVRIGLPASLGQAVSALGFTVLQGVVNSMGTAVIAAFGVGNRVIGFFNMPAIGFGQATASMVGRSLGAGDQERARTVVRYSVATMAVFITTAMTVMFLWGNQVTRFFVNDPEVISHGALMFRIVSPSVILFILFTTINGAFQGGGDTKPVMILNMTRLWGLRVPLAFFLAFVIGAGPIAIWVSMFVSNFAVAIAAFGLLRSGRWMRALNPADL